jgi:hypothetical protein
MSTVFYDRLNAVDLGVACCDDTAHDRIQALNTVEANGTNGSFEGNGTKGSFSATYAAK